jgi:hypothetical protein
MKVLLSLLGITKEDYLHFRLTQETLRKLFVNAKESLISEQDLVYWRDT